MQMARIMDQYWHGSDYIDPSQVESGGVTHEHTRKWEILQHLQVGVFWWVVGVFLIMGCGCVLGWVLVGAYVLACVGTAERVY